MKHLPVSKGAADAPLALRRQAQAEREKEIREGIRRRHFAVKAEEAAIQKLFFDDALAQAPTLRAILQQGKRP